MSTDSPPLGKFGEESLNRSVFPYLDESDSCKTRLRFGSDYNVVELEEGNALVLSTDPLAISSELGWKRSGKLALHVITTDVAVSGISPGYLVVNWNLPPNMTDKTFEKVWQGFTSEAARVGVKVVGGHTGRYKSQTLPMVGAGTAFGVGPASKLLTGEFYPGDEIYLLNELGLEAAAIFAFYYPEVLSKDISTKTLTRVRQKFDMLQPTSKLSIISSLPGVRVLHDVAEGGFLGGIQELLSSGDLGARIDRDRVEVYPEVSQICRQTKLDPMRITSIGSGIAIVSSDQEGKFLQAARNEGIEVEDVGEITDTGEIEIITNRHEEETLTEPVEDEFWTRLSQFEEEFN